jgi:hypothetical protein
MKSAREISHRALPATKKRAETRFLDPTRLKD